MKIKKVFTMVGVISVLTLCGCVSYSGIAATTSSDIDGGTKGQIETTPVNAETISSETVNETTVEQSSEPTTITEASIEETESPYLIEGQFPIEDIPDEINQVLVGERPLMFQGTELSSIDELDTYLEAGIEYAVYDFDQDGINELVMHPVRNSYIFRFDGERVYAHRAYFRAMNPLLDDGSCVGSSGASDTEYYEFDKFTDTEYVFRMYLWVRSYEIIDGVSEDGPIYYNEAHERISEEEAQALLDRHKDANEIPYKRISYEDIHY